MVKKRARADSVLDAKADGTDGLKKLKSSQNREWKKMKQLIGKDTTKLCLIQVPKGVSDPRFIRLNLLSIACSTRSSRGS